MVKTLGCGPRNEGSTPSFRPLYLLNPWRGCFELDNFKIYFILIDKSQDENNKRTR